MPVAPPEPGQTQSAQDYLEVAERWGYRYRQFDHTEATGHGDTSAVFSTGMLDTRMPQPGLVLTRTDIIFSGDVEAEAEMQPGLLVAVATAGSVEGWLEGAGVLSLRPQEAIAIPFDRTLGFSSHRLQRGHHQRSLSVFASPDWLDDHGLGALLDPRRRCATPRVWAPSLHLLDRIAQVMQPDGTGALGNLMAEALALELLAAGARQLTTTPAPDLNPPDFARMMRVRDILVAHPEADHTLASLAAEAGVSVSVLTSHFNRAFGTPVFDLLRNLRLERARRGLIEEGWTVAQAAYWAGFRHPTNFSTAFRRRFGRSPGALRR